MVLEKAYAAMIDGGYPKYAQGGNGYWAMRTISGVTSHAWEVDPTPRTVTQLASVKVMVPSAVGSVGHSFFQGGLNAIAPNPQVCVTIARLNVSRCTAVCPQVHECSAKLQNGLPVDSAKDPMVHVRVVDHDLNERNQTLLEFDMAMSPLGCTLAKPCTMPGSQGDAQRAGLHVPVNASVCLMSGRLEARGSN